jgi:hypothetical protein
MTVLRFKYLSIQHAHDILKAHPKYFIGSYINLSKPLIQFCCELAYIGLYSVGI